MSGSTLSPLDNSPSKSVRRGILHYRSILVSTFALAMIFLGYAAYLTVSLPDVDYLKHQNPDATGLMKERWSEARDAGKEPRRVQMWIPLDLVSERLVQAVITGEDAGFYTHKGFDFYEIKQSIRKNWERGGYARGASTITQQLAKNLFLSTDKSISRKIKEAVLAYRLEQALSKKRILEIYLNVIEWGEDLYGVEAAARTYIGKRAIDLDAAEAALLAAMIPNPRQLNPATNMKSLKTRQERILGWMEMAGHLTESEREQAKEQTLKLRSQSASE